MGLGAAGSAVYTEGASNPSKRKLPRLAQRHECESVCKTGGIGHLTRGRGGECLGSDGRSVGRDDCGRCPGVRARGRGCGIGLEEARAPPRPSSKGRQAEHARDRHAAHGSHIDQPDSSEDKAWKLYADGRIIWQEWTPSGDASVVPDGARRRDTGYVQSRLTPQGVQLLLTKIGPGATDLPSDHPVAGLVAYPRRWLPASAWATAQIRAFVPARYLAVIDAGRPNISLMPSPAGEVLSQYKPLLRDLCQAMTTGKTRGTPAGLRDAGYSRPRRTMRVCSASGFRRARAAVHSSTYALPPQTSLAVVVSSPAELPRRTLRAVHRDLLDVLRVLVADGDQRATQPNPVRRRNGPAPEVCSGASRRAAP